jgi:HK97 family phage major capsid protein/HK97 family phage prohead protease
MTMSYSPTDGMKSEAQKGLDWRSEFGRGGTEVGIARARDIVNDRNLSEETVKRMFSFFSRHEVDKEAEGFRPGEEGYPSNGRIAWALWGGDAGFSWSRNIVEQLDKDRAAPNELSVGDFVSWNSSGGRAQGRITRIERDGEINVPDSDFTITGTEDDPAALIRLYQDDEETEQSVGHKFSTLTKIDPIRSEEIVDALPAQVSYRSFDIRNDDIINAEERRVRIVMSTENPVDRFGDREILDHSPDSVDLDWMNSGRAPLLLDHMMDQQIGVIESVELDSEERKVRALVRFGRSALAEEVFQDVTDGIRQNISVGYAINKIKREGDNTYRVMSWRPMEASIVSIPADSQSRVGRSAEPPAEPVIEIVSTEEKPMTDTIDIEAVKAEAARAAQKDASAILELAAKHNRSDLARKAISEGRNLADFRGLLLDQIGETPLESHEIGMSKNEVKRFSLLRAIRALANPSDRKAQEEAAFEFEASRAAADMYGSTAQGVMIPADVLRSWAQRDLNTSDDSALVPEDFRAGDFVDVLRNQSSVMRAGARMLQGLSGNIAIPKKLTAASGGWIATEGGNSAESEATFGQITMTPKTVGGFTEVTRQMMLQSSPDIEALIRDDLTQALALAIDLGALAGTAADGQPRGVRATSGINTQDFAATNPTFAEIVGMETKVAEDNALMGNPAYIMNASMFGALKTTEKATNTAQFVVEPGGTVNGYRAIVSNQVAAGDAYFGNFADLLIGMYGGLDLLVDPYTSSASGTVRVRALQSVDVAVRHAASFCLGDADIA